MHSRTNPDSKPGSLWIGGRLLTAMTVQEPRPTRVEAVLWLDLAQDQIRSGSIVLPGEDPSALASQLELALEAAGDARPARVRVASESDADLVRSVLPGTPIGVGPVPELARIVERMSREVQGSAEPSYVRAGLVAPSELALFFERMAALWRVAPWRCFEDDQVLEIDLPAMNVFGGCVSVMGAAGLNYGAILFDSFEDFEQFHTMAPPDGRDRDEPLDLGVSSLGLSYMDAASLPGGMRREAAAHGWVVAAPEAYPLLMPLDPDGHARPVTSRDLKLACAVAEALAGLARRDRRGPRRGALAPFERRQVVHVPEPMDSTVWFPHTLAPGPAADREPLTEREIEQLRVQGDRRIEAFLGSAAISRRSLAWREDARHLLDALHEFKFGRLDGRLGGLRAWQVARFVLEHAPRSLVIQGSVLRHARGILDAYLAWLGKTGHEPEAEMRLARQRVKRHGESFLRRARDPASFGPAKALAMTLLESGVDLDDPDAVAACVAELNAARGSGPKDLAQAFATPPGARDAAPRDARPVSRRWTPPEGSVAPDAFDPCPCGSGRRYGKCCMRR